MMKLEPIRGWQLANLENNVKSVEWIVSQSDEQAMTTYRDGGTGWTVLEVLCHLRDFEDVTRERARLTVEHDNPPLPFPNPDQLAADNRYMEQSVSDALAEWKRRRAAYVEYMRARPESDFERSAVHPTRGVLTLFELLNLAAHHDTIHLEQMTRILNEKRVG